MVGFKIILGAGDGRRGQEAGDLDHRSMCYTWGKRPTWALNVICMDVIVRRSE